MDELDHLNYLAITAGGEGGGVALDANVNNKNQGRPYSLKLKLNEELLMPSYQATMDSFIKMVDEYGSPKKVAKDLWDLSNAQEKKRAKEFVNGVKHLKVEELRDRAYVNFAETLFRDTKARTLFFDELKSNGYNAIVDEYDKQFDSHDGMKTPVIVFDKSKTLSVAKSSPLSEADYAYLRELYFVGPEPKYLQVNTQMQVKNWSVMLKRNMTNSITRKEGMRNER